MSWGQASRFVLSKNFQLENCRLLLSVSSHQCPYYIGWNGVCLPGTRSRCWFSLATCGSCRIQKVHVADRRWAVRDADKTWKIHDANRTWAVRDADKTWKIHDADRTWAVRDAEKTWKVHGANRTWAVRDANRISVVPSAGKTHSSLVTGGLQIKNFKYFNLVVVPPSSSSWRHLSTSSAERTDKHSQIPNQEKAAATDGVRVDSRGTDPKTEPDQTINGSVQEGDNAEKKLTLYQRFKKTYKEHGKILIVVHLLTSAVWFGSFYSVAKCGVDVVSFMEKLNLSERIISPFRSGGLGNVAVAYLMYKLATPARYTVTIGGTNLAIRYLRREGKIPHVPHEDRIRSLYKEGKEHLKKRSRVHMRRLRKKHGMKSRIGHPKDKH